VPALNHIGLWVDKLAVAVGHLQGQGVRFAPGGIRRGASGHDVAFIHPKGKWLPSKLGWRAPARGTW
jgi:lactoylglutathione lyase